MKINYKKLLEKLSIFSYEICIECNGLGYVDNGDSCPNCLTKGMIKNEN